MKPTVKNGFNTGMSRSSRAAEIEDNIDLSRVRRKRRGLAYPLNMFFIHRVLFEHQLYRGEEKFPRTAEMTISNASLQKRELSMSFNQRLDRGFESTLWQWKIIDRKWKNALAIEFVRTFQDRGPSDPDWSHWLRKRGAKVIEVAR